jgi:aminoglycoside/choline kinase family phosphotransferase
MVLEDLGSESLLTRNFALSIDKQLFYLSSAIKILSPLQKLKFTHDSMETQGVFNKEKLAFELNLTLDHFSKTFSLPKISKGSEKINSIWPEFLNDGFKENEFVWCHRDYHSKNIMINNDLLTLIDFQDSMLGPKTYDLCSLLHDSYIHYPDEVVTKILVEAYECFPPHQCSFSQFEKEYYTVMAQRSFKAIGSFCFVFQTKKNYLYLRHVGLAMEHLNFALKKINNKISKDLIKLIAAPYYEI